MIKHVGDFPLESRRVFVRVDFNVPLDDGVITDKSRILATLPTIRTLMDEGAHVVLASHLGRPKGAPAPQFSLEPVGVCLAELLETEVRLTDDCIGDGARKVVYDLRDGQIALLENLRFHPGEEANDEKFAKELQKLADVYINDAFGAAHRAHASVVALPRLMPERAAGLLLTKELATLGMLRDHAKHPYAAVLGGAKVSGKIDVIQSLLERVDRLIIGGAMANTFLAAQGFDLGRSLVEQDRLAMARSVLERAKRSKVDVRLPTDLVVASDAKQTRGQVVRVSEVPKDSMALDIGPQSVAAFRAALTGVETVFWNGPMGVFENPSFSEGTLGVARAIADCGAISVVGGGDSVAAVHQLGLADAYTHLSTGGGASLEFLEGKTLPGVEALEI
ncbi:MAG: phosphoglycerate kinase [Myxococcales bacterium]|nr:phosphoglycerate kinase [Myxococcales bacterium]MCB9708561.1 phosphoglycerate kinase [Myxococcales bacterium]